MTDDTYQQDTAPHSVFQSLLDEWAEAIVSNDPERISTFTEPDWQLIDTGGIVTLQAFLDVVRKGHLTHQAMSFEVLSAQVEGNVAIVIAHGTNNGHWQGEPFTADEWTTEIFVRQDNGWKCRLTALTPRRTGQA